MFVVFATAMLTVEDDAFWQGVEPVVFGGLPQLQVRFSLCLSPPPPPAPHLAVPEKPRSGQDVQSQF